ncbi:MAG TPA: glutamine-hydrolyzing carbamoyl-phosphate synthase small subunit [Bacteroidota bacterium]|nr:glutamine-hydrolyzing carbamoyl-phosphate synthase small subunit [Bacteroidota bacterium]
MMARLVLENGLSFSGVSFGAEGEATGEVVFNTSITGYQEILTDPSYCGQIVTMTYPLIGNYGVNSEDVESVHPWVSGFVVKEYSDFPSNYRSTRTLGAYLREHGIVAIQGIDTRMLTKTIREAGAMRSIISTIDTDERSLLEKVLRAPKMQGLDLTGTVTTKKPYTWEHVETHPFSIPVDSRDRSNHGSSHHVVVYDYGIKLNILRRLAAFGCKLTIVPASCSSEDVLALKPDGIFLSNGPGDPAAVGYAIRNLEHLIDKKPIFGICLGHQLLAHALGGRTFKLKFGHRGANHPVKNLVTQQIEITSQNHGFAVDPNSLDPHAIEITHVNLNDGTNEGFRHRQLPVFSVQYHPEASPGPHDSDYLFRQFVEAMKEFTPVPA